MKNATKGNYFYIEVFDTLSSVLHHMLVHLGLSSSALNLSTTTFQFTLFSTARWIAEQLMLVYYLIIELYYAAVLPLLSVAFDQSCNVHVISITLLFWLCVEKWKFCLYNNAKELLALGSILKIVLMSSHLVVRCLWWSLFSAFSSFLHLLGEESKLLFCIFDTSSHKHRELRLMANYFS